MFLELLAKGDRVVRDVLGEAVTYSPGTGSPVQVKGQFDALYVRADVGEAGVSTAGPSVFFLLEDLPTDPVVDVSATVTVSGVTYRQWEAQRDGKGGVRLMLHRV